MQDTNINIYVYILRVGYYTGTESEPAPLFVPKGPQAGALVNVSNTEDRGQATCFK